MFSLTESFKGLVVEDFKKDRFSSEPGDVRMFRENQLQNLQQPPTLTQKAAAIQNAKP